MRVGITAVASAIVSALLVTALWVPQREWHVTYFADGTVVPAGPYSAVQYRWVWEKPPLFEQCIWAGGESEIWREYRAEWGYVLAVQLGFLVLGGGLLTILVRRGGRRAAAA